MTITANARQSVSHEYTTVQVDRDSESLYRDIYAGFGWTFDGYARPPGKTVVLNLKRDRWIRNRTVVAELQRTAQDALASIERLERSKTARASVAAYAAGLAGAAFFAGAVFSFNVALIPLFLFLGFHGVVLWAAPYFLYKRLRARRTAKVTPLIERHHAVLDQSLEQAARFLN
ncbi:hypothetical protein [Amycolatopsis sp. NPDC051061]|uniref:hypothetical protein n=1 Tax=Amycolatopsis sp. NPDC051061 TaxID=3155042 RepID=UPI003421D912